MNNERTKQQTKQKNGGFNMFKTIKKQLKNEKGLTLVELLAVIVILGIIAAIAIPAIGNIITNSKYNAAKADALNVLNAAQMYFLDEADEGDVDIPTLLDDGYLEDEGLIEAGNNGPKITNDLKLTTGELSYAKGRTVEFTGATIKGINQDATKGSKEEKIVITGDATTTPTPTP